MGEQNYYEILGIAPGATDPQIKRAYHRLARQYHPDTKNPHGPSESAAKEMFQKISEAYTTLSDPQSRVRYDEYHGFPTPGAEFSADPRVARSAQGTHPRANTKAGGKVDGKDAGGKKSKSANAEKSGIWSNIDQLAHQAKGGLNKILKQLPIGHGDDDPKMSEDDIADALRGLREYRLTIDALESLQGTTREVALNNPHGVQVLTAHIPEGVQDGELIRIDSSDFDLSVLDGEAAGPEAIVARISVVPHRFVEREANDVILKIPITISEAINGTILDVPTCNGTARVKLPPMHSTSKRLRLKGRGVVNPKGVGDLYVRPYIVPPDTDGEELRKALEVLQKFYSEDVRKEVPESLA